jgi:quinol monooxygenase YgiN
VQPGVNTEGFRNYLLAREPHYQRTWTRIVDQWRDGEVF